MKNDTENIKISEITNYTDCSMDISKNNLVVGLPEIKNIYRFPKHYFIHSFDEFGTGRDVSLSGNGNKLSFISMI